MKTIIKSAKLMLLMLAIGLFIGADFVPRENATAVEDETLAINKLPVVISCYGCSEGNGVMIAHNPRDRNLYYYADPMFDVRWYSSADKPYAAGTHLVWYICNESFTVKITNKKTGERGTATFGALPCKPVILEPYVLPRKNIN